MTSKSVSCTGEKPIRPTILLVEDERFVREATCRILSSAGFEVVPAADAQEATQAYDHSEAKIDLVITDLVLPGRSGLQLIEDLRRFSPGILVLLTSGYRDAGQDEDCLDNRTYYLAKPYSRGTLVAKIRKILDGALLSRTAKQAG